jgi:hypothetical protein
MRVGFSDGASFGGFRRMMSADRGVRMAETAAATAHEQRGMVEGLCYDVSNCRQSSGGWWRSVPRVAAVMGSGFLALAAVRMSCQAFCERRGATFLVARVLGIVGVLVAGIGLANLGFMAVRQCCGAHRIR